MTGVQTCALPIFEISRRVQHAPQSPLGHDRSAPCDRSAAKVWQEAGAHHAGRNRYAEQVQHTGAGCNDLFLDAASLPKVPNSSFALTLANGQGNATALFILGIGLLPTPTALFGCPIYLNIGAPFLTVGIVTLNGSGSYSLGAPIPNNPALVGVSADMQAAASAGSGTATSNALTLLLK